MGLRILWLISIKTKYEQKNELNVNEIQFINVMNVIKRYSHKLTNGRFIVKTKDHELLTFRDELNQLKVTADISGVIKLSLNLL